MKNRLDKKKILLAGFLAGFAIAFVWLGFDYLVQQFLPYDASDLSGTRAMDDPLMAVFFLHPWVIGFSMAAVYPFFTKIIRCKGCKPKMYALIVWILTGVPQFFIVFTSMDYPVGFYINQLLGGFLYIVAASYVIWKILD